MMFLLIEINSLECNFLIELSPAGLLISVAITLNRYLVHTYLVVDTGLALT